MPPIDYVPFWQDPLRNLSMVILPALTVGYRYSAVTMRMTRSAMLEVLREDYIRTARAKGLVERLDHQPARAQERAAAGRHPDRHRVRVPDRRARGDRAGVQPQRRRPPVRAGGPEPGLHADAGPRHAHGRGLRVRQSRRRSALRVARSAHPLRLSGSSRHGRSRAPLRSTAVDDRGGEPAPVARRPSSASAAASRSAPSAWRWCW